VPYAAPDTTTMALIQASGMAEPKATTGATAHPAALPSAHKSQNRHCTPSRPRNLFGVVSSPI
jgi:hypothetical protein